MWCNVIDDDEHVESLLLVVVGMEARAVFYDSKTGAELGDYTQSHTDTITQVGNTV